MPTVGHFKENYTIEYRRKISTIQLAKHPDSIPVIVEFKQHYWYGPIDKNLKHKFMLPKEICLGQCYSILKKHFEISEYEAIFIFIDNQLYPMSTSLGQIYAECKDVEDDFLYMVLVKEETFG